MQFPVTTIVLIIGAIAIYFLQKRDISWLAPHIFANSIVGFVYMIAEQEGLATIGTGIFGQRFKTNIWLNILINLLVHIVIPVHLLSRISWTGGPFCWKCCLAIEITGLALIDTVNTYPSHLTE